MNFVNLLLLFSPPIRVVKTSRRKINRNIFGALEKISYLCNVNE